MESSTINTFVPQLSLYKDVVKMIFDYVRTFGVLAMVCKQFRHWIDQIYNSRRDDWKLIIKERRESVFCYLLDQEAIIPLESFIMKHPCYSLAVKYLLHLKWLKSRRNFERDIILCDPEEAKIKIELFTNFYFDNS